MDYKTSEQDLRIEREHNVYMRGSGLFQLLVWHMHSIMLAHPIRYLWDIAMQCICMMHVMHTCVGLHAFAACPVPLARLEATSHTKVGGLSLSHQAVQRLRTKHSRVCAIFFSFINSVCHFQTKQKGHGKNGGRHCCFN